MEEDPMLELIDKVEKLRQLHNAIVPCIVFSILHPITEEGGDKSDIVVLLESVVAGVILSAIEHKGRFDVLDLLIEGVRERLGHMHLGGGIMLGKDKD